MYNVPFLSNKCSATCILDNTSIIKLTMYFANLMEILTLVWTTGMYYIYIRTYNLLIFLPTISSGN